MRKNIVWLDYARVLGISLVIFGHALQRFPAFEESSWLMWLWDYIYLFHMPLFFIISGFLFRVAPITMENIRSGGTKIVKTLIIPYFLYQFIYLPILFISKHGYSDISVLGKLLCGIFLGDGYETAYSIPVCLPCWFIVSIIQLRLLFLLVPINKCTSIILGCFSIAFLLLRKNYNFDLLLCLDSTVMAIPYFLLGHYLNMYQNLGKRGNLYSMAFVFALIVGLVLYLNGAAQMIGPSFGKSVFLNFAAGISGTFCIFALSMRLANRFNSRRMILKISRNTLFIIFLHWFFLAPCCLIAKKMFPFLLSNSVLALFTSIVLTIGILWTSKYFIDKLLNLCPILLGKYKKI